MPGADCRQYPLLFAIGLVFFGAGATIIIYALRTGKSAARLAALRALHPDEPWLWREDWGAGRVEHSPRREALFLWLLALGWNGVTIPLLFLLPREVAEKGNRAALLGFLFPVVGAGLLIAALRATRSWLRHGVSRFELARVPGVVGGRLEGRLHARLERAPDDGVRLVLTCVRRTMAGSGGHRAAHEAIAWQEEAEEGRVEVRRSWLGVGWTRSFPVADVTGVGLRIGMQHGGSAGTPYYDLVIQRAAGRPLVAARHILGKRDAERLASEMRRAIGVRDPVSFSSGSRDPVPAGARGSGRSDA